MNALPSLPDPSADCEAENYEKLFRVLPYGVMRFDAEGVVRQVNPAASRILGVPLSELYMRAVHNGRWQITDATGNELPIEDYPLSRAIRTGQPVRSYLAGLFNPALRSHIWISGDVIPQQITESGRTEYWVIFHDVTEEYEANAALKESRSNLDLAQRVASVGSAVYNYRKRRWSWSAQLVRLYGITEQESRYAGPDAFGCLVDVADREAYLHGLEVGSSGVPPYPLEFNLVRSDGSRRIVYREAELIEDAAGVAGIIFTHKDITEAREAEQQKEMLQGQLYHAQRLEALGTLASGIAHDINNTLVPIIGLTQAILATPATDPQIRPLLELIERSGTRARDLVRRVVEFSRNKIPRQAVFNLSATVLETMKLARAMVSSTIELRHEIADVGMFEGDATQVHQLLLNLITNAAQAIGNRRGQITVSLRNMRRQQGLVELKVTDTGDGMDAETQKRIFEPFFTTKSVGEGTGLGLSVVHGIVRSHGGTVNVKSAPGRGSTFQIQLPKYPAARP